MSSWDMSEINDYIDRAKKLEGMGIGVIYKTGLDEILIKPRVVEELEHDILHTRETWCSKCVNENTTYTDSCERCLSRWVDTDCDDGYDEPVYFRQVEQPAESASERKGLKIFISGPMRGYEDYNTPMFNACEKALRDAGYDVFNPAWMKFSEGWGRDDILSIDLQALSRCDGICQLPDWSKAAGARLEYLYFSAGEKYLENQGIWMRFDGKNLSRVV